MATHIAVLREEVVRAFEGATLRVFFDGTVGAGGHAEAILHAHPEIERYLACDRDPKAHAVAKERLQGWGEKVEWIRGSYSDLERFLIEKGIETIDGFLIDIGVSSTREKEALVFDLMGLWI